MLSTKFLYLFLLPEINIPFLGGGVGWGAVATSPKSDLFFCYIYVSHGGNDVHTTSHD